ncbi:MAG: formate dehydrogenase subunit gamma [Burkholderiaceae bacterium]|jgi:formate dehydrogenase subunit gamma|nr:formate dehydrogenase subunit gamma [Burkholderiaceae bacterium]
MNDLPSTHERAVRDVLARHADTPGALLPVLHDIQDALGFVPPAALPAIAAALDLSRAEVHGVLGYYPDFRSTPPAPHRLRVCRAEACRAMGGQALLDHARQRLGCDNAGRSANGAVDVEAVYCLGLCACSPALMLDGQLHARVDAPRLDALVDGLHDPLPEPEAHA